MAEAAGISLSSVQRIWRATPAIHLPATSADYGHSRDDNRSAPLAIPWDSKAL
jgi:hypothetical protein